MRQIRTLESQVFGYVIERVETRDPQGAVQSEWYELRLPSAGNRVIGAGITRGDVERIVVRRELEAARRAYRLNHGLEQRRQAG